MGLGQEWRSQKGYAMAALLVGLSVMAVLMSAAMPVWSQMARRDKEEELIWRGQQYARAIGLFQRKYANTFPPNVEILVEQRFLRRKYKDPITGQDFQMIPVTGGPMGGGPAMPPGAGQQSGLSGPPAATAGFVPLQGAGGGARGGTTQPMVGIQGVVSKSTESSIKIFNGRTKYNEWLFVHLATTQGIGAGGPPVPRQPPNPGDPRGGPGQRAPGMQPGSSPFQPLGGSDRRPGIAQPPQGPGAARSPFGPPQPPSRPPGN